LRFAAGVPFADVFDAVLGAQVAQRLGYAVGDELVVAHGAGKVSFVQHEDKPFRVAGILARTGTPVDRTVHVSLAGIEAMHIDWHAGAPVPGRRIGAGQARAMDLTPRSITAFLVGLDSRTAVFSMQRAINDYAAEPLLAIIPGVALQELWDLMGVAENALRVIAAMVVVTGLLGMLTVILASLDARRREMAVLRSVGARPLHVFGLFVSEAGVLALLGCALGVVLLYAVVLAGGPILAREFGLYLAPPALDLRDLALLGAVVLAGLLAGTVPALRAYRLSLSDGLSMRI
jgi:putative ABC transport system permease protein